MELFFFPLAQSLKKKNLDTGRQVVQLAHDQWAGGTWSAYGWNSSKGE